VDLADREARGICFGHCRLDTVYRYVRQQLPLVVDWSEGIHFRLVTIHVGRMNKAASFNVYSLS
jgi:hypothetical protein